MWLWPRAESAACGLRTDSRGVSSTRCGPERPKPFKTHCAFTTTPRMDEGYEAQRRSETLPRAHSLCGPAEPESRSEPA